MNYTEVLFTVSPKAEASDVLIAQLAEIGFESFVETELGFSAYILAENFDKKAIEDLANEYKSFFEIAFTDKEIAQQNWNKLWESNFEPIDVKGACYIRAPFHEAKNNYQFELIIEPKMSFGTGHHQTTRLMIGEMMLRQFNGKSVLDMGCGTGVLAILAAKMNAKEITAIDVDDWCIENSIENIERNNIPKMKVFKGDASSLKGMHFDIIIANINKNVLLNDIAVYTQCLNKNGLLFLSGFFVSDVEELKTKANECNLHFVKQNEEETWAMLLFNN